MEAEENRIFPSELRSTGLLRRQ